MQNISQNYKVSFFDENKSCQNIFFGIPNGSATFITFYMTPHLKSSESIYLNTSKP